jgi:hypothetical protein
LSLKVHFFDSNSNFSSENLGTVSNEHGEWFRQEISTAEKRHQGKLIPSI